MQFRPATLPHGASSTVSPPLHYRALQHCNKECIFFQTRQSPIHCSAMTSVLKQFRLIAAIIERSIFQPVVKEKLIKIIQYYTQFLIAYHHNATKAKLDRLKNIVFMLSTCRKSIRFGRCLNHAYNASQIIAKIRSSPKAIDLHVYGELSEELCNVVHFFMDSRMMLYRAGVLVTNDTLMDNLFFLGDFGADLSVIIHSSLKLLKLGQRKQALLGSRDQLVASMELGRTRSNATSCEEVERTTVLLLADCDAQLARLTEEQRQATMKLVTWSVMLISSGNYPPINIWRRLLGADCPNTVVGLSGVLSSSLIIYETVRGIRESFEGKEV